MADSSVSDLNNGTVIADNQVILSPKSNLIDLGVLALKDDTIIKDAKAPDECLSACQIYAKLYSYQVPHVKHLVEVLTNHDCGLDSSDTGTGKTYAAVAIAALLHLDLFVVCPKSVVNVWLRIGKVFNVKISACNYELLKIGKYYDQFGQKVQCPSIEVLDHGQDFKWSLPKDCLLVFDEVHKCKNIKAINGRLLTSSKGHKVLMLSATVADRPHFFANCAYMLDLCTNIRIFNIYLKQLEQNYPGDPIMYALHKRVFPAHGARLRIADLGDLFPKNQVVPEAYTMGDDIEREIQQQYELLNVAVQDLKKKEAHAVSPLERMIRARQKIEALKVPTFLELIENYLENGYSVSMFVNYRDTLNLLANKLNCQCLVHGEQTMTERDQCINNFQDNKTNLIVLTIQSGGVGISLHDIHGDHPRVSLISPTWSAGDLVQALGRIYRAGGQTPCLQRIIFCANTIEEQICANLQVKINNYAQINDGQVEADLQLNKM